MIIISGILIVLALICALIDNTVYRNRETAEWLFRAFVTTSFLGGGLLFVGVFKWMNG